MNSKTLLPMRKKAAFSLLFLGLFLWGFRATAQIPQLAPANFAGQVAGSSGLATVNTAMIECPGIGGFLSAIIWGDATGTNLYLTYAGSTPTSVTLPISNAALSSKPDVILGDDPNNPGVDYIAVVCYQDINGDIIVEDYNITNILGTMTATPGLSQNLGAGSVPKIDGFANNTASILGLPAMDEFVVVWNKPTLNTIGVYAGEVANVTNAFFQDTYTNAGINPDVAAVRDIISNQLYACVACFNTSSGTGGVYYVYDINVSASPTPLPVITNLGGNDYPRPRIEGMALYKKPAPKWSMVKFIDYNNMNYYTDLNPSSSFFTVPTGANYAVAIAAGPGPFVPYSPGAIVGNRQITLAWGGVDYSSGVPKIASAAFDYSGFIQPLPTPPYNPGYKFATVNQFNVGAIYTYTDEYEMAVSASCNSGNELIVAWWNSISNQVFYKLTNGNQYAFKTTSLEDVAQPALSFCVFPNPADNNLYIKYSGLTIKNVRITDALGKKVLDASYKDARVDISSLPAGDYFISITTEDNSVMTRPLLIAHL